MKLYRLSAPGKDIRKIGRVNISLKRKLRHTATNTAALAKSTNKSGKRILNHTLLLQYLCSAYK